MFNAPATSSGADRADQSSRQCESRSEPIGSPSDHTSGDATDICSAVVVPLFPEASFQGPLYLTRPINDVGLRASFSVDFAEDAAPQPAKSIFERIAEFGTYEALHAYSSYSAHCSRCSSSVTLDHMPSAVFDHHGLNLYDYVEDFTLNLDSVCSGCVTELHAFGVAGWRTFHRLVSTSDFSRVVRCSPYPSKRKVLALGSSKTALVDLFAVMRLMHATWLYSSDVDIFKASYALSSVFRAHLQEMGKVGSQFESHTVPHITNGTLRMLSLNPGSAIRIPPGIVQGFAAGVVKNLSTDDYCQIQNHGDRVIGRRNGVLYGFPSDFDFEAWRSGSRSLELFASGEGPAPKKPPRRSRAAKAESSSAASERNPEPQAPPSREPRVRKPAVEREVPASVAAAQRSIAAIREANADMDMRLTKTITNIDRRLTALAKAPASMKLTAANFRASPYSSDEIVDMMASRGAVIPGNSFPEAAMILKDVVEGRILHPKRFGEKGTSFVIKCIADKIFTVPPTGTGGWSNGNILVVGVPKHASYKGAVVFAVNQTTGIWRVISYIAPDRDPELITNACAVLYSSLTVSAPISVTATSLAVTSQLMLNLATVYTSPTSLIAGKVAPVAEGGVCDTVVIGPEPHRLLQFSATDSEALVQRLTPFDPQNTNLIRVTNSAALGNTTFAYPEPIGVFCINAVGNSQTSASAAGYQSSGSFVPGGNQVLGVGVNSIWRLSNCTDFQRHMLYGGFELSCDASIVFAGAGNSSALMTVTYDNGDGTDSNVAMRFTLTGGANASRTVIKFNSRGQSIYAGIGAIIRDITLAIDVPVGASGNLRTDVTPALSNAPVISVKFLDVPATTSYAAAVFTGALSGFNVAVGLTTHVEVLLDRVALNSTFLSATDDLPYDPHYLPTLLRAHMMSYSGRTPAMHAKSFGDMLRGVLRVGGKIGSAIAPYAGPLSSAVGAASSLATRASRVKNADDLIRETTGAVNDFSGSRRASSFRPAGGSPSASPLLAPPPPSPAINTEPSSLDTARLNELYQAGRIASPEYSFVCSGSANTPDWVAELTVGDLCVTTGSCPNKISARHAASHMMLCLLPSNSVRLYASSYGAGRTYQRLRATSFGPVGYAGSASTNVRFPAVTGPESNAQIWALVPIVHKGVLDVEVSDAFPSSDLGYPDVGIEGRSGTLALLIANLKEAGFPVHTGLTLSGEVVDITVLWDSVGGKDTPTDVEFTILPVADAHAKTDGMHQAGAHLHGLFADGWWTGHRFAPFKLSNLFPSSVKGSFELGTVPDGYPGQSIIVTVRL